jgi:hypothetical protein
MESREGTATGTPAPAAAAATASTASSQGGRRSTTSGSSSAEEISDGVRVSCLMNARYHTSREAFLDNVHRWFMFTVIILGAGALIDVVHEWTWAKEAFALGAAVIAALDLTFDLSNRARMHSMMKRRYFELMADFGERKKSADETRSCLDRFSADEEPPYDALLCACWNAAQETVFGRKANRLVIPWWHRVSRNFLRHGIGKYELIEFTEQ